MSSLIAHVFLFAIAAQSSPDLQDMEDMLEPAITQEAVDAINSAQSSWIAGVSRRFLSETLADVKSLCGTFVKSHHARFKEDAVETKSVSFSDANVSIPSEFDVRSAWPQCANVSGHVRDQSACGSCWAFAATSAFNDRYCVATGDESLLSPQDTLANCRLFNCFSLGCSGGQPGMAWAWFRRVGVVSGGDFSDVGTNHTCAPYSLAPCAKRLGPIPDGGSCPEKGYNTPSRFWSCSEHGFAEDYYADKRKAQWSYRLRSVRDIQLDMMEYGSVSASYSVYSDFPAYESGVYHRTNGTWLGGHAVKLVGWGTDHGEDYWLAANSWNTTWGENGFFRIRRGVNECGIEDDVIGGTVAYTDGLRI